MKRLSRHFFSLALALALLCTLSGTAKQFSVAWLGGAVHLTSGTAYIPAVGELTAGSEARALPVRQDVVEADQDHWTYSPATYLSNGPYRMAPWQHNSQIVAVKNDQYYGAADLGPDTIRFMLMDDTNAMLSGYRSGALQFILDIPPDETAPLLASGQLKIEDYLGTGPRAGPHLLLYPEIHAVRRYHRPIRLPPGILLL